MGRILVVLTGLALCGCYEPQLLDCALPCTAASDCASGHVCSDEGLCRPPGASGLCEPADASIRRADATDPRNPDGSMAIDASIVASDGASADAQLPSADAPPDWPTLHVTLTGAAGTVRSMPTGINCTNDCAAAFAPDTVVTLTAFPSSNGIAFDGWSGDPCTDTPGPNQCALTLDSDKQISANFSAAAPLTIKVEGMGRVVDADNGIDCDRNSQCGYVFPIGTTLSLVPTRTTGGWDFQQWLGACAGQTTCLLTLTGPTETTAVFTPGG